MLFVLGAVGAGWGVGVLGGVWWRAVGCLVFGGAGLVVGLCVLGGWLFLRFGSLGVVLSVVVAVSGLFLSA